MSFQPYFVYRTSSSLITCLKCITLYDKGKELPFLLVGNGDGEISIYSLLSQHLCTTIIKLSEKLPLEGLNSIIDIHDLNNGYFTVYNRARGLCLFHWEVNYEQVVKNQYDNPKFIMNYELHTFNFCKIFILDQNYFENKNSFYFACPSGEEGEINIVSLNLEQEAFQLYQKVKLKRKEALLNTLWYNRNNITYSLLNYNDGSISFNFLNKQLQLVEIWNLDSIFSNSMITGLALSNDMYSFYMSNQQGSTARILLKYPNGLEEKVEVPNIANKNIKIVESKVGLHHLTSSKAYYLACGYSDGKILLFSNKSLRLIDQLNLHKDSICCFLWFNVFDKEALFAASKDSTISMWYL